MGGRNDDRGQRAGAPVRILFSELADPCPCRQEQCAPFRRALGCRLPPSRFSQQVRARRFSWKSPETIRIMHPHSDGMHLALATCHASALKEAPELAGIMRGVCSISGHCRFYTWHASKDRRPEQSFHLRRTSYAVWRQNRPEGIGNHDGKRSRLARGCTAGGSIWRLSGTSRCARLGSWKRPTRPNTRPHSKVQEPRRPDSGPPDFLASCGSGTDR